MATKARIRMISFILVDLLLFEMIAQHDFKQILKKK
jgi:hypothetical protein